MFDTIEIYSKDACPACNTLKTLVETDYANMFNNVKIYKLHEDVSVEQLTEILGFQPRAVPQVIIDGQYIGSYSKTITYLNNVKTKK